MVTFDILRYNFTTILSTEENAYYIAGIRISSDRNQRQYYSISDIDAEIQ